MGELSLGTGFLISRRAVPGIEVTGRLGGPKRYRISGERWGEPGERDQTSCRRVIRWLFQETGHELVMPGASSENAP